MFTPIKAVPSPEADKLIESTDKDFNHGLVKNFSINNTLTKVFLRIKL